MDDKVVKEKARADSRQEEAETHMEQTSDKVESTTKIEHAAQGVPTAQMEQVTAMGRSMIENLRATGAYDDADQMESVLRQMDIAAQGQLGPDDMKQLSAGLDSMLSHASEGLPEEVVERIKAEAPKKYAKGMVGAGEGQGDSQSIPTPKPAAQTKPAAPKGHVAPAVSIEEQAQQRKAEGNAALKKGRLTAALNRYTEAIHLKGDFPACFSNRSMVHYRMKAYDLAAKDAEECIRLDPEFIKGYMRLAAAQISLKRYAAAKDTVRAGMAKKLDEPELVKLLHEVRGT